MSDNLNGLIGIKHVSLAFLVNASVCPSNEKRLTSQSYSFFKCKKSVLISTSSIAVNDIGLDIGRVAGHFSM